MGDNIKTDETIGLGGGLDCIGLVQDVDSGGLL